MTFSWKCPFCKQYTTINDSYYSATEAAYHAAPGVKSHLGVKLYSITCPNEECGKTQHNVTIGKVEFDGVNYEISEVIKSWEYPEAKPGYNFPEYIPVNIRTNYEEACALLELSPKSSALFSRKALHILIKTSQNLTKLRNNQRENLEICIRYLEEKGIYGAEELRELRRFGRLSSHLKQDVNMLVEVEPEEAKMLVEVLEYLIREWCIRPYEEKQKRAELLNRMMERKRLLADRQGDRDGHKTVATKDSAMISASSSGASLGSSGVAALSSGAKSANVVNFRV